MRIRSLLVSCALLILPLPLLADTMYTYTGNDFLQASTPYSTAESVSGYFDLSSPLAPNLMEQAIAPTAFSFSDGYDTFTNVTSLFSQAVFRVSTDAPGNLTTWIIDLQSGADLLYTRNDGLNGGPNVGDGGVIEVPVNNQDPIADILGSPGTWTESSTDVSAAPEPSSLLLFGTGMAGAFGFVRRRLHN
jgi:hypothetical protein